MLPNTLTFVDLETTGGRVIGDRIIEVGIIRVENGSIVGKFNSLINPETHVSPFIEQLTGINSEELTSAPTFEQVKDTILELLADSVFVAHNVRFDYAFMRNELRRYECAFTAKQLCTVRLSQLLFPEYPRHNLDSIIERFKIACVNRHRAFDDAQVIYEFYHKIIKQFPEDHLFPVFQKLLKKPSIPPRLVSMVDELPESAGVYMFYDKDNAPLYVGKSVSIRDRVLSHFSSDYSTSRQMDMCQEIDRIECYPTSGELGALLRESHMIKSVQPIYNRQLRNASRLTALKKTTNDDGYDTVQVETLTHIDPDTLSSVFAITRSQKQAKEYLRDLAKKNSLCEKLLGLQKTKSACFAHHLGWCKGACVGKELPVAYNIRLLSAFAKTKIQRWPFDGPIKITEKDEFTGRTDYFIIDKWCLLGVFEEGVDAPDINYSSYKFDYDIYKILKKYIINPYNQKNIKALSDQEVRAMPLGNTVISSL